MGSGFGDAISGSIRKVAGGEVAGRGLGVVGVAGGGAGAGSHRAVRGRGRIFREGICWVGRRRNKCPSGRAHCCPGAARVESISNRGFEGRIRENPAGIPRHAGGKLCAGASGAGRVTYRERIGRPEVKNPAGRGQVREHGSHSQAFSFGSCLLAQSHSHSSSSCRLL